MGKDQELLEAARNGNVTLIEKILYQKGKRSGPLASLRRGPGANIQDSTGYSALHHAALNGRTDCVRLLLAHDASPNLPDYRGSSPLHLAAWAGHQDIVKLLLTQSTRPANPNLQTIDNETPLHCAAQHGHTGALTTLLAHGANPKMANNRGERPLDLAAQYGRLQVVQMLIRAHPELLLPYNKDYDDEQFSDTDSGCSKTILTHSPLHLASRNGHKHVVDTLLAAGVDVNLLTTSGTALHEAALCGKDTVVKALLDFGADLNVTDSEGRTALDLLKQFPPHVTKGIIAVINNHQNSFSHSEQEDLLKVSRNISTSNDMYGSVGSHYSKRNMRQSNLWNSYSNESAGSMLESPSSSVDSLDPSSPRQRPSATDSSGGGSFYVTMVPLKSGSKVSPTPPKKPPRRNLSISPTTSKPLTVMSATSRNNATGTSNNSSAPYEYIYLAHSGNKKSMSKAASVDQYVKMMNPQQRLLQQQHQQLQQQLQEESFNNLDSDQMPPTTVLRSYNPNRKLRRIRDNYDSFCTTSPYESTSAHNESDDNLPMSPSNYKQPPTPEHPPPNAKHAEKVILERIRPLSQEYRRSIALDNIGRNGNATFGGFPNRSRNQNQYNSYHRHTNQQPQRNSHHFGDTSASPSSSDLLMCHSLNASSGSLSSSVSLSDRSASTDCVEEFIADVPFAGLFKGSTMTLDKPNLLKYGINNSPPMTQSNSKPIQMPHHDQTQPGQKKQSQYLTAPISISLPQQQQHQSRPERPRTLDTQTSSLSILKSSSIPFSIAPDPLNSHPSQTSNSSKLKSFSTTAVVGVDAKKPVKLIENHANTETNKVNAATTPSTKTFDEQEEWAKISEIMANFGTDESLTTSAFGGSTRRRVYQNRMDNGRSNSVAGYASYSDASKSHLGLSMHSVNSLGSPRDIDAQRSISPHGQLIDWLYSNELESLDRILYDNGFDDVDFIRGVLDECDLDTLDVPVDDRPKLMAAIENDLLTPPRAVTKFMNNSPNKSSVYSSFNANDKIQSVNATNNNVYAQSTNNNNYSTIPKQKNVNASSESNATVSVDEWLNSIKLQQYSEVFKKHLYTDMERISRIWEIELQAVLEINKLGHRKRILYSVGATPPAMGTQLTALANSTTTESSQRNASGTTATMNSDSSTGEHRRNHRKNRQAPKPPTNENILAKMNELKLEIRAPSELLLGFPTGLSTQWRHTAEALVSGAVKYEVNYLGSTVVKELRGTESTRKSIQKLKKGERITAANAGVGNAALNNVNQNMKRAVYILISHRGVQFVDIQSQGTICEHEIRNINCACQDADDLSHFAYITKDSDFDTHYCHVFNVVSMDLATEIILTLGQAFEVAYQIALRKSTPTPQAPSPIDNHTVNATTNDDSVVQKEQK